jgi:hypothetical protein
MIKKLYSARKHKKDRLTESFDDSDIGAMGTLIGGNKDKEKEKVLSEMKNREIFSYKYWRFYIYNSMWCPRKCCPEKRMDR